MTAEELNNLFGNSNKQDALELLGTGLPESKVAELLELTPAMISHYKEDPRFQAALKKLLIESTLAAQVRDQRLDDLEDIAITQMEKFLPMILRPNEVLHALKTINGLQRRSKEMVQERNRIPDGAQIVKLTLPANTVDAEISVKLNSSREIVEVEGEELRTMPSADVMRSAQRLLPSKASDEESDNKEREKQAGDN